MRSVPVAHGPTNLDDTILNHTPMTPPPRSLLTSLLGHACDPHRPDRVDGQNQAPTHQGCQGWWALDPDDSHDGWLCGCSCHADGRGWPGYDTRG